MMEYYSIVSIILDDRVNRVDPGLECTLKNCNIKDSDDKCIPDRALLEDALSSALNDIKKYGGNVLFYR